MEPSSPKPKKRIIFQDGTLNSQAKKISSFLRPSKNKFIHSLS